MNIKLLVTSLSIIIFSNTLLMISIVKLNFPYAASMLTCTIVALLLWFFFLKKDVQLNVKHIDMNSLKGFIPLILVTLSVPLYIITTSESVNYAVIGSMFTTSLLISIYEEVLFRGIGLNSFLNSGMTTFKAILFSSIVFSLFHTGYIGRLGYDIILLLINTFMMGFVLGFIYYKTKNILFVILIHFLWDFAIFINQELPTGKIAASTTLILFATTILYFTWSIKQANIAKL